MLLYTGKLGTALSEAGQCIRRFYKKEALASFLVLLATIATYQLDAQSTRTWANSAGGAWTNSANWSPAILPVAGDNVIIGSGLTGAITAIPTITLNNLTIDGSCQLDAGARGNTITVNGTMSVPAGVVVTPSAREMSMLIATSGVANINGSIAFPTNGVAGTFICNGNLTLGPSAVISGLGTFTLNSGATMAIGSVNGITLTAASGNIQTTTTRTYNASANYTYNGIAAQSTGDGLPATLNGALTISNPTTVTLLNTCTLSTGSLNLTSGTFAAGTLLSLGNSTSTANVTINRSEGTLSGSLQQSNWYNLVYTGASKPTGPEMLGLGMRNVTINLDAGNALSLDADRTVAGTLTLTRGNIRTNTFTLLLGNSAIAAITGGSAASYINGTLTRSIAAGGGNYAYPIGTGTAYAPVTMNLGNTTTAGTLTGFTSNGDNSNIGSSTINTFRTVNRSWSFTKNTALTTGSYSATFKWFGDQDLSFDYTNAVVGRYNGSSWSYPTLGSKALDSIQIINETSFGAFQIGKQCLYTAITTPPSNVAVCQGTNTTFSVVATGDGILQYEWSRGDQVLTGEVSSTLTANLSGNYKVKVSGECESATSSVAVLSYKAPTTISIQPVGGAKCAGDHLQVTASGEQSLSYLWYLDGNAIASATAASLPVDRAGNYTVQVSALCGQVTSDPASVTMNTPTSIFSQPQNATLTYGDDASFSVGAEGTGQLTYRWQVYSGTNWNNLSNTSVYSNTSGNALNVNDPIVGLTGFQYKCFVSGLCGTAESQPASITVNKAVLTVTPNNATRIYGDNNPSLAAVISGYKLGQNLATSGVTGDPEVTTSANLSSGAGTYPINAAIGTLSAANYSFSYATGTLTVQPASLTVKIDSLVKQYGEENPTLTYAYAGFKNGEVFANSGVTGDLTLKVNASASTGVGNYPVIEDVNTLSAPNYAITVIDGNLRIEKAVLEITANDKTRLYGDLNPEFTFSVSGFKNGESLGDSVMRGNPAYATPANELSNVGPYEITPTLGGLTSPNYNFHFTNGTLSVRPAPLTVKASDTSRIYGEANPVFAYTYSGFKNGQDANTSDLEGAVDLTTTADLQSPYGDYTITTGVGDLTSSNYELFYENGTMKVEKATITVTIEDKKREYGVANPAPTFTYSGFKNSENEVSASFTGAIQLSIGQELTTGVGTYPIIVTSNTLDAPNYIFNVVDGSLIIEKAVLVVKAENKTRIYGDADPEFSSTITGYKNEEDASTALVTGGPDYTTDAVDTSSVGTYSIWPTEGDLLAPNYIFTFEKGDLSIEKAALLVKAVDKTRKYGTANPVFEADYIGFKNGEDYVKSDLTGQPALTTDADKLSPVGPYVITTAVGDLASRNYALSFEDGALSVSKADIAVTIESKTKTYGDANPPLTYTLTGFENEENETTIGLTGAFAISVQADETSGAGTYSIAIDTNTLDAFNYAFNVVPGSLIIEKAVLDVAANSATRVYGDPDPAFSVTITGFKNSDDLNSGAITGEPAFTTNATATSNVGNYEIYPDTGRLIAANYTFNFIKGPLSVTAASLTVSVKDTSRVYGDDNPTFEAVYTGFKNGEDYDLSDLSGQPSLTTTADPLSNVGPYVITAATGGLSSMNYALSYVNGTLTVTKALLTVKASDTSRMYGAANPVFSATYNGFKNGQVLGTSGITGSPSLTSTTVTSTGVGTYPITAAVGTLASTNYAFSVLNGILTINQATLTVTADNKFKAYGSANPALTVTYTGLITGQTLAQSDVTGTPTISTTATDTSWAGTYPITFVSQNLSSNNYKIVYSDGIFTVNKANITVQANNQTREYGDANPELTYTMNGLVLGQDFSTSGITGAPLISTTAINSTSPGNYTITAATGSLAATNYAFVMANGTLTITKAVLTVKADDKLRAYGAANPSFTATYSGFKLGQDLSTSNVRGNPGYSTTAVASSPVGDYPITITSGNLNSTNYSFSLVNGVLSVGKATVTVTANNQSRAYGNANPALTVAITGFVNGQTLATSGITGSASVTTPADSTADAGIYTITPSQGTLAAANYTFAFANGTLTITKAAVAVVADTKIKIYGDANPVFTATYNGLKLGQDFSTSGITGAPALTTTATASTNVGTYTITAAVGTLQSTNYSFTYTSGSLIIGKAPLTITADNKSKTYGSANPALTATYAGFKLGQTLATSGITGTASITTTAITSSGAGTYPITVAQGTMVSTNYSFTFVNGTLTVSKAVLNVTADNKTKTYGAANPALTVTYTGFVSGQTLATSGVTGTPVVSATADASSIVGVYPITIGEGTLAATNYSFTYSDGTLTVGKATISVTADGKTKLYGEAVPALTYTLNGFVNGEDLSTSGVNGVPAVATTATSASAVGTYPITTSVGTLIASNYQFSFVSGTLTVSKATLLVKANDASRAYGAANPSFTASYNGFVNGETFATSGITGSPSVTSTATASSPVGTYTITAAAGTLNAANYSFSFGAGTLTVTKAVLTVTADNKLKTYGAANPALTYTVSGFVNGQTLATSGVTGAAALATNADVSSPVGVYPITTQEGTLAAPNYTFSYLPGNLTVSKAVVTVTAQNATRTYGAANPSFTATYSGFVNGEDLSTSGVNGIPVLTTTATPASAVSTYSITAANGTLAAANYSFLLVNGTLTVTKAALTVKAEDKSKVFGAANPALTVTYNGFVNGETLASSGVSGTPSVSTTAVNNSITGKYPITVAQGSLASGNYTFNYAPGILTVNMGISFTKVDPLCLDGAEGSVTISALGGNGSTLSYSVDNGATYKSTATITGLGVGTFTLKVRDADGNESVTTDAVMNIDIARWVGASSGNQTTKQDWLNAANWSTNKVPTATTHVIIPTGFTVNLGANTTTASVQVAAGSTLNVAANVRLTIAGKCGALPN